MSAAGAAVALLADLEAVRASLARYEVTGGAHEPAAADVVTAAQGRITATGADPSATAAAVAMVDLVNRYGMETCTAMFEVLDGGRGAELVVMAEAAAELLAEAVDGGWS